MEWLFWTMTVSYVSGALSALALGEGRAARVASCMAAAAGALSGMGLAAALLTTGRAFTLFAPGVLSIGGGLALRADALSAIFLLAIGAGGAAAAIYASGYLTICQQHGASLRLLGVSFNLFLLAMSWVVMADNVITFLLVWEAMSLSSYFLVIAEPETEMTLEAGLWYFGMAHIGFLMTLAALLLLASSGPSGSFADIRAAAGGFSPSTRNLVFVLALLGFGSKAGVVPLHVWLPRAHPAAPSHVSALMSGIMIKMGIYGLIRVCLDLLGGGPAWWGGVLLGVGAVSALIGILYALMEQDLKRLLAYSSIENIGIILLGLGSGFLFHSYGLGGLALLGFVGALYHTVNHACFKGLLFLGAGSVLYATRTRNMEELGGLIRSMPATAFCFLLGSAACAALPPLNGFASEWMVFQSLLGGFDQIRPEVAVVLPVAAAMLALAGGLAAACFVKAFGITFLALPRSKKAEKVSEVPVAMRSGMLILAAACAALGVFSFAVVPVLARSLDGLGGISGSTPSESLFLVSPTGLSQASPALTAIALTAILLVSLLSVRLWSRARGIRLSESWGCGRIGQSPRMEYTATSFAEPLRRIFEELYRPTKELTIDFHPESRYFVQSIEYRVEVQPWFEKILYDPILRSCRRLSLVIRRLQSGSLHHYLWYVAAALICLLLAGRWL